MFHAQRLVRSYWFTLLLPYSVIAGGGGGGGGEEWKPEGYESAYVEAAVTITCLALALAFEKVWHHLYHHVHKSHQAQESAPEDLFKDLMNRAGSEFMTLGFLAFCIFLFNNCGGFKYCVHTIHDEGIHLPITDGEWLHLAEVVHMQLFLGMIIYFAVISRTVRGAVARLRQWDKLQAIAKGVEFCSEFTARPADKDLQEYLRWSSYFNSQMVRRSQQNHAEFADLFAELDIDSAEVDFTEKLHGHLVEHFSLYRYLALNVSAGVRDSVQIHTKTWFVMIVLFVLFGLLHRCAHWTMYDIMPAFVIAAIMILLVMHAVVRRRQVSLHRRTRPANEDSAIAKTEFGRTTNSACSITEKTRRLNEQYNTEIIVLRTLQVMLFLISYILARDLIDVKGWKSDMVRSLTFALVLSAILLLFAYWLPRSVPLFLGLMSLPPYVDEDNFRLFADVLLKCKQESEVKMVRKMTSKHRGLLLDNGNALAHVLSQSVTKDSRSRSDIGAALSGRRTTVDGEGSKLVPNRDDTLPSGEGEHERSEVPKPTADCHAEEPPEPDSPGAAGKPPDSDFLGMTPCEESFV